MPNSTTLRSRIVPHVLLATPLVFALYILVVAPRPYFVYEMDAEPDYYYNAKLILTGHWPRGIHHPGTPVYYLGAVLMRLSGASVSAAPAFFRLAHASACVALFLALVFFRRRIGTVGAATAVAALAAILAWPTVYTYADFFAADSFVLPLALAVVVLVRAVLRGEVERTAAALVVAGAGTGACLAVKMSAVPVAVATAAALATWRFLRRPNERPGARSRAPLIAYFASAFVTYFVLIAPVLDRILENWIGTFARSDARPPAAGLVGGLRDGFVFLAGWNALLALGIGAAGAGFVVALVRLVGRGGGWDAARRWIPEAVLVGLMALGFLYAISASADVSLAITDPGMSPDGPEPGVHFRNVAPAAAALPLLVLFGLEHAPSERRGRRRGLARAIAIFSVAALAVTIVGHARRRATFIATRMETIRQTRAALESRAQPPARLAFWTGPSTDLLGEASFHFWGNYRYAEDGFDRELLDAFPRLTFFRGMREMRIGHIGPERVGDARPGKATRSEKGSGPLRRLHEWMKRKYPPPAKTEEFFSGEQYGVAVAEIAIPTGEAVVETRHAPPTRLLRFVTAALRSPVVLETKRIGATEWTFARPAAAPAAAAAGP